MIFWITHILASGFLLLEIYLLAVRRCRDPKQQTDRGPSTGLDSHQLRLPGRLPARPEGIFFEWPDSFAIFLLADLLLMVGIVCGSGQ